MSRIFEVPYTETFLLSFYNSITQNYSSNDLASLVVLLPDQNSVINLKTIFRDHYSNTTFLPQILALSDCFSIAKAFALELDYAIYDKLSLNVKINITKFVSRLSYIEADDKLALIEDLIKLLSELYSQGYDLGSIDLAFLNNTEDERILRKILEDFSLYITKHQLEAKDYIQDFYQTKTLFDLATKINDGKITQQEIILAGSTLSLYPTQKLARALINHKRSSVYLYDFASSGFDLDNDFVKNLKAHHSVSQVALTYDTKKQRQIVCKIFSSKYSEINYLNSRLVDKNLKIIVNDSQIRLGLSIAYNPYLYQDDLIMQKYFILGFFSNNNEHIKLAELLKDRQSAELLYQYEQELNYSVFARSQNFSSANSDLSFSQKYQFFITLIESNKLTINSEFKSIIAQIVALSNHDQSINDLLDNGLLELFLNDVKITYKTPSVLSFSYEAKLCPNKKIIIAGLNQADWINDSGYKYIKNSVIQKFGIRSESDYKILAISDLLILLNSDEVELTLSESQNNRVLPILYYFEHIGLIKFENIKPLVKPAKTCEPYAIMSADNKITKISVSDFSLILNNPYGLYIKRILGLINLQKVYKTSVRRVYGVIIHKVIEEHVKQLNAHQDTQDELTLLTEYYLKYIEKTAYKEVLRLQLDRTVNLFKWWIKTNKTLYENSVVTNVEVKYQAKIHPLIEISAIIDRIEKYDDQSFKLIDYKTSKLPTKAEIESGSYTQLILESLIYLRIHNLSYDKVKDPCLVKLVGDAEFAKNEILNIDGFAGKLAEFEDKIITALDDLLVCDTKLYSYPHNTALQNFSDYIHITRKNI